MLQLLLMRIVLDKDKYYMEWLENKEYQKWLLLVKILRRTYMLLIFKIIINYKFIAKINMVKNQIFSLLN